MDVESRLARHVHGLKADAAGAAALEAFDRLLLDFVTVVLAGAGDRECRAIAGALDSPAFRYGTSAHWFDWDDTHDESHVHGGAVIFPAVLTAFGMSAAAPEDVVAATIAGYDVACRIGGFLKAHAHRGWMPTGTGATIGAAAAAARVLGLDEARILSAMGIAAANAGLSRQALADRTNAKAMLAGIAAKTAVEAAILARAGANGAPHFLTGPYGLHALHASSHGDPADVVRGLGTVFSITEVSVKPYPCCRSTHAVIDGIVELRRDEPQFAARVDAIAADVPAGVYERCGSPFAIDSSPRLAAQFSIPFVAAFTVRRGAPALEDFAAENVVRTSTTLAPLIEAVRVRASSDLGEGDALAPVVLRFSAGGSQIERHVKRVSGSPESPVTGEQAREKLRSATVGMLSEKDAVELETVVRSVRKAGPRELILLLSRRWPTR